MRIADLIIKKRDGCELTDEEVQFFIKELVDGRLEGSQLGIELAQPFLLSQFIFMKIEDWLVREKLQVTHEIPWRRKL